MNIYVRSVNKNERDSVDEINYLFLNDVITSKVSCEEKNFPPATLAAASLHWLSQMKMPFHTLQVQYRTKTRFYDIQKPFSIIQQKKKNPF